MFLSVLLQGAALLPLGLSLTRALTLSLRRPGTQTPHRPQLMKVNVKNLKQTKSQRPHWKGAGTGSFCLFTLPSDTLRWTPYPHWTMATTCPIGLTNAIGLTKHQSSSLLHTALPSVIHSQPKPMLTFRRILHETLLTAFHKITLLWVIYASPFRTL